MAMDPAYHGQVTLLDTSATAIAEGKAATTTGINNTGNVTSTGTHEAAGGIIITADNGKRVKWTPVHAGGTLYQWTPEEL